MPTFAVLFEDRSDADPNIRHDHMPAHLSFLEANAGVISDAGPLRGLPLLNGFTCDVC